MESALDLKQLTAVITVAETGSVTRAAHLLGLVQPAVTRQLKALEAELGVELFERTRSGMVPTTAGEQLVGRARRAMAELDRARVELRPDPGILHGIVTVGLLESMTDLIAAPLVSELAADHPGIELRLMTAYSGHLQEWLDEGILDLTLLYNLRSTPALNVVRVAREQLWVVAPPGAGLHLEVPITLAAAVDHPLVLPGAGHGLRTLIDEAAARAHVAPAIPVETNSMRVQKQLVLAGHGWTILPGIGAADDVEAGVLSAAPLSDPEAFRDVVLAVRRDRRTPTVVETVREALIRQLHRAVVAGNWPSASWRGASPTQDRP